MPDRAHPRPSKPPRYAPAREDGQKPYLVEISEWGRKWERIIYADKPGQAEYEAKGRMRYVYAKARRATPADVERVGV